MNLCSVVDQRRREGYCEIRIAPIRAMMVLLKGALNKNIHWRTWWVTERNHCGLERLEWERQREFEGLVRRLTGLGRWG